MSLATPTAYVGAPRGAGPISTLTTPYTYATACTEIFALTEITYSDATETVIISDISDTRFGACQPTGFTEVEITSRFTYSPAVCPEGWTAYSLSTTDNSVSTGWCCNSGYTLYSATDWPIEWATQPCVKVIEEATTIAETIVSSGTAAHAPWHISWKASDTTTMWPVPPAWAASDAQCIDTWTPGGATVYATTKKKGMSTSTENGKTHATTTTKAAGAGATTTDGDDVDDDDNGVVVLDSNSTLFWFLVIGLPILEAGQTAKKKKDQKAEGRGIMRVPRLTKMAPAKIVFGGASFMSTMSSPEQILNTLSILKENGIEKIDTGYTYGDSEECLGRASAPSRFTIDTKNPGGLSPDPAVSKMDGVMDIAKQSLARLQTDQVDVYYLHAPDRRVPFAETLEGINTVRKTGAFRRFGLSNFLPAEVEEIIQICKDRNYMLPTVYQGSYNAIQRLMEVELLPVLRKHQICYYAYSPSAGGFLAKTPEQLKAGSSLRWDPSSFFGEMYHSLYTNKETTLEALRTWHVIAEEEGIPGIDMAYRWVVHHSILDGSLGDSIIFGAMEEDHLRGTLAAIQNGPLSKDAVGKIEKIWDSVKFDSHLDNFNGYLSEYFKKHPAAQSSETRGISLAVQKS